MEKWKKTQELITPPIKITPPPPPPRTHLSKDSRLKHLFKASNQPLSNSSAFTLEWNTLFLLGLTANLFLTACPSPQVPDPPPMELTNQELGDRWGLFQVVLDEEDALYHFGVIPAGESMRRKAQWKAI